MINRTNFLKKVEPKASKSTFDFKQAKKQTKIQHHHQKEVQVTSKDIIDFIFIGIFDKKVITTFNQKLQIFGFFDFHAIHQRIRYQYFHSKLLASKDPSIKVIAFDEEVIEKERKPISLLYGQPRYFLLRIDEKYLSMFHPKVRKIDIWGIELQKNSHYEVYAISSRSILGKELTDFEVIQVLEEAFKEERRVPKLIDDWIGEFSCKSAYKFNDTLPSSKAKLLISNLSKCSYPWHCVHGRNTVHIKPVNSLHA